MLLKNIFTKYSKIFLLLFCILIYFTSCSNFLSGANLIEEINQTIEYNNAKTVTLLINQEEGTGSTVPYGNYDAKAGYPFKIQFTENSEHYCFIKWVAVLNGVEVTEGVTFENPNAYETNVTVNDIQGIRIYPKCEKRIELSTDPSPKYEPNGVSRDRSITVEFTKAPKSDCFIFAESELPEGAEAVKNDEGQIWAYKLENYTYLKKYFHHKCR